MPGHCWEVNRFEPEDLGVNRKLFGRWQWGMSSQCGSGIETHLPQGPGEEKKEHLGICRLWGGVEFPKACYLSSKMLLSLCGEQRGGKVELEICHPEH